MQRFYIRSSNTCHSAGINTDVIKRIVTVRCAQQRSGRHGVDLVLNSSRVEQIKARSLVGGEVTVPIAGRIPLGRVVVDGGRRGRRSVKVEFPLLDAVGAHVSVGRCSGDIHISGVYFQRWSALLNLLRWTERSLDRAERCLARMQ